MTSRDLTIIKARLDKASPGPWRALAGARKVSIRNVGMGAPPIAVANPLVLGNDEYVLCELSSWIEDGDRDLIVHARTDIERLYDEVRAVRAHLRAVLTGEPGAAMAATAYFNENP